MADEDLRWCDVCDDCSHYKAVGDEKYQCTLEGGRCRGYFAYKKLKAENAALRERLEKAVEIPCKVGDKVYEIIEGEVQGERVENYRIDNMGIWVTVQLKFGTSTILLNEARKIFLTREAAEARLKELGGRR